MATGGSRHWKIDRRSAKQRRLDFQRELEAMSPAERTAWELLSYSEIPVLEQARDIVAAIRPHLLREAADEFHQATEVADAFGGYECSCGKSWLTSLPEHKRLGIQGCEERLNMYSRAAQLEGR